MAHSHFSTSYIAHGLLFSLFSGSFKPFYLFKTHLFISWACDLLFLLLGLNGFSIRLPTPFCLCCWASSSHLGFQNGPQHLAPWTYEAFMRFICEWKTFLPFLSFHFIFLCGFFWTVVPTLHIYTHTHTHTHIYIYIYIYISVVNIVVPLNFPT